MLEAEEATGTSHAGADNAEDTDSGENVLESEDGDFIGVPDGDRWRSPGRKVASGLYVSLSTFFATLLAGMARIEVRADRLTVPTLTTGQATFGTAAFEPTASLRAALSASSPFWSEALVAAAVFVTSSPFSGPFNDIVAVAVAAVTAALVSVEAAGTTGTSHAGSDNAGLEIDPWSTDSGACTLDDSEGGDFTGVPEGDFTGVSVGGRVADEAINSFLAVSFSTVLNTLLAGIAKIDLRDDRCFAWGLETFGTKDFEPTGPSDIRSVKSRVETDASSANSWASERGKPADNDFAGLASGDRGRLACKAIDSTLAESSSALFNTLFSGMAKIDIRDDFGLDRWEVDVEVLKASDIARSAKSLASVRPSGLESRFEFLGGGADTAGVLLPTEELGADTASTPAAPLPADKTTVLVKDDFVDNTVISSAAPSPADDEVE
jgi:hypothetical protein